jgi:parallel beta-helix repeat protein
MINRYVLIGLVLTTLCVSTLELNGQPVKADWTGTILIKADGSIDPDTAPISTVDNITYTLTDNIYGSGGVRISVLRGDVVVDGIGHTVRGEGTGYGIRCSANNVTIRNVNVVNHSIGIVYDPYCSLGVISGNNVTACIWGIKLEVYCCFSMISENHITDSRSGMGIWIYGAANNTVIGNNITGNLGAIAIRLDQRSEFNVVSGNNLSFNLHGVHIYSSSKYNIVSGNKIESNADIGIGIEWLSNSNTVFENVIVGNNRGVLVGLSSSDNMFYHNTIIDNIHQVSKYDDSMNIWDDGYPSGGNYWSDYVGVDLYSGPDQDILGSDGIGDSPYLIEVNNQDNYPLMKPLSPSMELTVSSLPIVGIPFSIDGDGKITPYTDLLPQGSYTLEMPETYDGYVWSHWLEDGDTNRIKLINIQADPIWTGVYAIAGPSTPPVGGEWVPIDKLQLLAPWIGSISMMMMLAASFVYVKHKKRP